MIFYSKKHCNPGPRGMLRDRSKHKPGDVSHLRVILSYAFDTFSQVDCVSG